MAWHDFLPYPLLIFAFITSLFSLVSGIISLVDYSVDVAISTTISTFFTLGYHLTLITLAYRESQRRHADAVFLTKSANYSNAGHRYYTTAGIIWGFILLALWVISFGLNTQITSNGKGSIKLEDENNRWNLAVQIGESVMTGLQSIAVGAMAVHNVLGREKEKRKQGESKGPSDEKRDNYAHNNGKGHSSRSSIASSRFSVDSITALPEAHTKFGSPSLSLFKGKLVAQSYVNKYIKRG